MQCKAKSKRSGKRCQKPAIKSGTVCRMHGGGAPQVKKKARERFNDLVDPAINRLEKAINDDDVPTASAIAAAKDILDRAGYKPGFDLNLGGAVEINDPGRDKLTDDDLKKLIELLEAAEGDQE